MNTVDQVMSAWENGRQVFLHHPVGLLVEHITHLRSVVAMQDERYLKDLNNIRMIIRSLTKVIVEAERVDPDIREDPGWIKIKSDLAKLVSDV